MPPVPLDDWQVGPHNRWAYLHVEELVPTVRVPRGTGPVRALPERPEALDDLAFAGPDGTSTTLAAFVADGHVDGLAVAHRGALVLERYGGEMGPADRHLSQSVGKSVLGLLCGVLAGDGRLDPDAPVADLVPEVAGSGYAGARVRHLLDMTAAVSFVEDYAVDFWRYDVACAWHPPVPGADAENVLAFLPAVGPAAGWRHGERLHYATPTTDLLGLVAGRAGGAPLGALLARELWAPLGAEADALLTVDRAGTGTIGGGFCPTLRDVVRLGLLVLDHGAGVVPADWVDGLGRGEPAAFLRPTAPGATAGASGYGRQWWRRDGGPLARGIHGQLVAVDDRAEVVVAILSSWPDATDARLERAQRALVAALVERLG